MKEEILRIAYGSENVSINKGDQHIILTESDMAFIVQSGIRNLSLEVTLVSK